jgi:predicted O-methyltransferase YrrM
MNTPILTASGTYLPVLMKLVDMTNGPILEFGTSAFSTTFLHFACYEKKRKFISYENNPDCYKEYKSFENDYHKIVFVKDWDSIDLSGHYSVVLIDHDPASRRRFEIARLANNADYIVVHDAQPRSDFKFKYSIVFPLFRYRKDFNGEKPFTTVLSNFKNLSNSI